MDRKAVDTIKQFLKRLQKDFSIDKVIFFGSRATKDYMEYSDIDLVIISKDFEDIDFTKRMSLMYKYWNSDYDVDFLCYTPKEFEKLSKMITIAKEAKDKGIVI